MPLRFPEIAAREVGFQELVKEEKCCLAEGGTGEIAVLYVAWARAKTT
jgi:hypothetical protein